jgi:hypothetical protein
MLNKNIRLKKNELISLNKEFKSAIKLKKNPFKQFSTMILIIMITLISNSN